MASGYHVGQHFSRALGHFSNFSTIVATWRVFLPRWYLPFLPRGQLFCTVDAFSLSGAFVVAPGVA